MHVFGLWYSSSVDAILFFTVEDTLSVAINDSTFCITSECLHQECTIVFKISIMDKFSRTFNSSQKIMNGGCVSFGTLQMNAACAPYYVTIEAYNKILVYNRSIVEIQGIITNLQSDIIILHVNQVHIILRTHYLGMLFAS